VVRFPELGPITAPGHATETDVAGTTEPRAEPVEEIKLSVDSRWDRELLLRLMRQRGLEGYRRKGQRHTTVLVRARPAEIDELWDDFVALSSHLEDRLDSAVQAFVDALQWQGERPRIPADSVEGAAVPDQGQLFPQMPQRREA
jgi:hypothetical protein